MNPRSYTFHVVSYDEISDFVLNRLHDLGFDWSRSPTHYGLDDTYHFHYLFYSDHFYTLSAFKKFLVGDDNIDYCEVTEHPAFIINFIFHT